LLKFHIALCPHIGGYISQVLSFLVTFPTPALGGASV
jgi:hypothetical protein